MDRRNSMLLFVSALLLCVSTVMASPNNFTYQGNLTDASGTPVVDGSYSVQFKVWNDATSTAGPMHLWNSGSVSVSTIGGFFSIVLGNAPQPAMPLGLFSDPSLWLGITVGADPEISPRTSLTSVPYALSGGDHGSLSGLGDDDHPTYVDKFGDIISGTIDHQDAVSNWVDAGTDIVTIDPNNHKISTFDASGNLLSELLDNSGFGEFKLYRGGLADDRVHLFTSAGTGSQMKLYGTVEDPPFTRGIHMIGGDGSRLLMYDQIGNFALGFDLLSTISGNSRVNLPDSAVASNEMLDEPGLAHEYTFGPWTATSGTDVEIDSVSITVPASGYVLVLVNGYIESDHVTGSITTG